MYKSFELEFGPTVKEIGAKAWLEDFQNRVKRMNRDLAKLESKSKGRRSQ